MPAQDVHQTSATAPIDTYIHLAWDTLSRSMNDCKSVADSKLARASVMYLPHDLPEPAEVKALESSCKVEVRRLPRRIEHLGDIKPRDIAHAGLLYLPNRYVVPGGRFNEMYGWDSYFILLGLIQDGRVDLARGMVENFFFEIENYGGILNANRTYYFTRSQPPFLSSMIRAVYDAESAAGRNQEAAAWIAKAYPYAVRDHALWENDFHKAGGTGLARYYDLGDGPVEEMADDSTYYPDVIRWLLAHPQTHANYLVDGPENPNPAEQAKLAETSCDARISEVCAHAHVDGHWLSSDFYKGDRAMRESGFDPSFRFGVFDGSTHHYAPVCLNSLLYKYETDLNWMAERLGKASEAKHWRDVADARRVAMNKYLWNAQKGTYFDYDFVASKQADYDYVTVLYPLWAGVADEAQAKSVEAHINLFERAGGLAMSDYESGVQWDLPYGWAPATWVAVDGLVRAGDNADAVRISRKFMAMVRENYRCDRTIREKYDVVTASTEVNVASGYKQNVIGFGWTNATYEKMQALVKEAKVPEEKIVVPQRSCADQ
ncbi:trehalase family glycosidase [Silvibacterium bohemicum]|nr:trehalase family glycosidase [Silvibacterium bohemicum]